jgi:hypothetical protein
MIKYSYREKLQKLQDNSVIWDDWSEELFNTKEEIDKIMQEEYEYQNKNHFHGWVIIDYKIKEVEISNLSIEGNVENYGEYEDYTVCVGDIDIARMIINKFKGQKIKVHIDVEE